MPSSSPGPTLTDLVPAGMFVGTSLILCPPLAERGPQEHFLCGVRAPYTEGEWWILELTGIGGALEDDDRSPAHGVQREAREETSCEVRLVPCSETLVVHGAGLTHSVRLASEERPAAVVHRHYGTPPHQPWHEVSKGQVCVVVFLAELQGHPFPVMELPALIWLTPEQIVETARRDVSLSDMLGSGALLIERIPESLPRDGWARLTDSQEALVLALADQALPFYRALWEKR